MHKPPPAPEPVAKTLTEQKSDFTAEGSPPPGKVSTTVPVIPPAPANGPAPPAQPQRGRKAAPDSNPEPHP